jgi:hypothetical protein
MAVTLDPNIDKIVFTSANMPSPQVAGLRSHIIPSETDLGLWYESGATMTRASMAQNIYDISYNTGIDRPVFGISGIVTSGTSFVEGQTNTIYVDTEQTWSITPPRNAYIDDSGWFVVTNIDAPVGQPYKYALTATNWENRKKEINQLPYSGIYLWGNSNLTFTNSVVVTITFGEAYNCYLTAWDDNNHSTTDNTLLSNECYRVSAVAFATKEDLTLTEADIKTMYCAPQFNKILKGNDSYYGKFNINCEVLPNRYGAYFIFKPILINIPEGQLTRGIYEFKTAFHFSYT